MAYLPFPSFCLSCWKILDSQQFCDAIERLQLHPSSPLEETHQAEPNAQSRHHLTDFCTYSILTVHRCDLCRLILECVTAPGGCRMHLNPADTRPHFPYYIAKETPLSYSIDTSTIPRTSSVALIIGTELARLAVIQISIPNDRQIENSRGRRMYPDEPLRETTINQIKTWLTECTTPGLKYSHERCERTRTMELGSTNRSHLPKRLLFIEAERKLILQRTSSCQADLRYATLSHCWGTESEASLWRQTSISDDGTVDLASAPKLLADMMKLLWTLGLHYFWVDALCIDQNSETEWLQESIRMSDIYRRGFLNISATSSKHGGEGLFHPKACTTRIMLGAVSPSWKADLSFTPFPEAVWDRQVKQAKLSKRGWVLQERLFSPRILHFCSGEILWECQSCRSGEMMESFSPPRDLKAILVDPDHDLSNRGFDKQQLKSYRAWDLLVETYSNMRLTKPSDKLVAIAGVASHLANFLRLDSSNYVAGHWRDGLPESLLWHCRNGEIVSGRAPSWSWAKFDGPVDFFWNPLWSFHCKIVAICADERSDAFVAGSSHWIKARCPLAILDFTKKVQKNSAERSIWSKVVGKRDNTRGRTNPFITAPWKIEWEEEFSGTIAANHWYYALCMSSGVDSEGLAACEGLVITPTRCSKGQFKRVGSFKLQLPSIETIAIYGKDVALVPEEMYISFDANDGFEIELL